MSLANDILKRLGCGEPRTCGGYDASDKFWCAETDKSLLRMRESGMGFREIAERFGVSTAAVAGRYARVMGYKRYPGKESVKCE